MKILFIAPRFHNNLYYRVKALQDVDHEVFMSVFYTGETERHDTLKPNVLGYSRLGEFMKKIILSLISKKKRNTYSQILSFFPFGSIRKEMGSKSPDLVILKGFLGLFALQVLLWARFYNKKIYLLLQTNKHYPETQKKKIQIWILKKIFRVQGIITPLKNTLNKTDDFFKYIPFIVETFNFEKKYFDNNQANIISIGKFVERKNHLLLLKAVRRLKEKYPIFLTIIGEKMSDEVLQNINRYIKNEKLEKMVQIKYNLENKEVLDMYRRNDLFVLPSYNEPAAYSILEAMASKLPVICSDSNGTKCYIKEGENGYIFRSRNLGSLKDKIERLIIDKRKTEMMGEKSFEMSQNQFSNKIFISEFDKILGDNQTPKH